MAFLSGVHCLIVVIINYVETPKAADPAAMLEEDRKRAEILIARDERKAARDERKAAKEVEAKAARDEWKAAKEVEAVAKKASVKTAKKVSVKVVKTKHATTAVELQVVAIPSAAKPTLAPPAPARNMPVNAAATEPTHPHYPPDARMWEQPTDCPDCGNEFSDRWKMERHRNLGECNNHPRPIDVKSFASSAELEALSMEVLKASLTAQGLKCGGTAAERADRLFSTKDKPRSQWNKKILAGKPKGTTVPGLPLIPSPSAVKTPAVVTGGAEVLFETVGAGCVVDIDAQLKQLREESTLSAPTQPNSSYAQTANTRARAGATLNVRLKGKQKTTMSAKDGGKEMDTFSEPAKKPFYFRNGEKEAPSRRATSARTAVAPVAPAAVHHTVSADTTSSPPVADEVVVGPLEMIARLLAQHEGTNQCDLDSAWCPSNELVAAAERECSTPSGSILKPSTSHVATLNASSKALVTTHEARYKSPLLQFRAYRLSPFFRTKEQLSLSSISSSNKIDPQRLLCRYALHGKCNDPTCYGQHQERFTMTDHELLQDLVAYDTAIPDANDARNTRINQFTTAKQQNVTPVNNLAAFAINDLFKRSRKSDGQMAVEFPTSHFLAKPRTWRPRAAQTATVPTDGSVGAGHYPPPPPELSSAVADVALYSKSTVGLISRALDVDRIDAVVKGSRYFEVIEQDDPELDFQKLHGDTPNDCDAWINHAEHLMTKMKPPQPDHALHILSAGLEHNPASTKLWEAYMCVFMQAKSATEALEMAGISCNWAPSFALWTIHRSLPLTATDRIQIACDAMQWRLDSANYRVIDPTTVSVQILELVLFIVQMEADRGNIAGAVATTTMSVGGVGGANEDAPDAVVSVLQPFKKAIRSGLRHSEQYVLWMVFGQLVTYGRIPTELVDASSGWNGSIICGSKKFSELPPMFHWPSTTKPKLIWLDSLFIKVGKIFEYESPFVGLIVEQRSTIHMHLYDGYNQLSRILKTAEAFCVTSPKDPRLWMVRLQALHVAGATLDGTIRAAVSHGPNPELIYGIVKMLISQNKPADAMPLLTHLANSMYEIDEGSDSEESDEDSDAVDEAEVARRYQRCMGITVASYGWQAPGAFSEAGQMINSSLRDAAYLQMCYCLLLELSPMFTPSQVAATYEWTLTSRPARQTQGKHERELFWSAYFEFQMRLPVAEGVAAELLATVRRCLLLLPTKAIPAAIEPQTRELLDRFGNVDCLELSDYTFYNAVFFFYLKLIPKHKRKEAYVEIRMRCRRNTTLTCHAAELEVSLHSIHKGYNGQHHASGLVVAALEQQPQVLVFWKLAIALELANGRIAQVRWLYNQARERFRSNLGLWIEVRTVQI
jgi:hypothetical protein